MVIANNIVRCLKKPIADAKIQPGTRDDDEFSSFVRGSSRVAKRALDTCFFMVGMNRSRSFVE